LGFLKGFPHKLVGDFSTGTGFAGPFSTISLLSMRASGLTDSKIFIVQALLMIMFYYCFNLLYQEQQTYKYVEDNAKEEECELRSSMQRVSMTKANEKE